MWTEIIGVRPGESRDVAAAMATVVLVLSAHGALETARDTLFLTHLPASQLPWVYLALAACGVAASRVSERSFGTLRDRGLLVALQLSAAAGTAAFWLISGSQGAWVFYVLYVWVGVAAMVILIRLWLLLSNRFDASQAKRLFPIVSAASVLGAMIGFAIAGALSRSLEPRALLAVSAGLFLLSAGAASAFSPQTAASESFRRQERPEPRLLEIVHGNSYLVRVGGVLMLANLTVTIGDILFKSAVARSVPPESLGTFFATAYFGFNLVSLVTSLFVTPLVRRLGIVGSIAVLPAFLVAGALGFSVSGGLAVVLFLRGADGAFRFSIFKSASELLYVPMPAALRSVAKGIVELVANRGGQALASVIVLVWLAGFGSKQTLWIPILFGALGWLAVARSLREPYFDLFRRTLEDSSIETRLDFPELRLASLETLIAALNAADDRKVLAAMEMLRETDRITLIPALILYHPSPGVVARALDLFVAGKREDFLPIANRLLAHSEPVVRTAALRAQSAVRPSEATLRAARGSGCAAVDVTALVGLVAHRWMSSEEGLAELGRHLDAEAATDACGRVGPSLAKAIREQPAKEFVPLLERLVVAADLETRLEAIEAMGRVRDARIPPLLVPLLAEASVRSDVRRALAALDGPALDHLAEALGDPLLPLSVRIHLPRSISAFRSQRAMDLLLARLPVEPSGMVRYKILRGLGRMVADDASLRLDTQVLDQLIESTLRGIFERLHSSLALERGAAEDARRRTVGHELLIELLRDKRRYAIERLFRALGLRYRSEDLAQIYRALAEGSGRVRSSGRELLESVLPPALGGAVLGLLDDVPDEARLAAGAAYHSPHAEDYASVLSALVRDSSETLALLAQTHALEIGFA